MILPSAILIPVYFLAVNGLFENRAEILVAPVVDSSLLWLSAESSPVYAFDVAAAKSILNGEAAVVVCAVDLLFIGVNVALVVGVKS